MAEYGEYKNVSYGSSRAEKRLITSPLNPGNIAFTVTLYGAASVFLSMIAWNLGENAYIAFGVAAFLGSYCVILFFASVLQLLERIVRNQEALLNKIALSDISKK